LNVQQGPFIPSNIELEQQVIGAVLGNNERYHDVSGFFRADHFFDPVHARIWKNIAARISKEHPANHVTLKMDFEGDPGLEELGGAEYLARLVNASIASFATGDNARELVRVAEERKFYEVMTAGAQAIRDRKPLDEVKASVEVALSEVKADGEENSISLLKAFTHTLGRMAKAYEGEEDMGIRTQIAALDARLGGLFAPDLLILAGRPSMGKAQPFNSKIRTSDGWVEMGEIAVGDSLASVDGAPSKVTGVFLQGEKQIMRVNFVDGRSVRCCSEHLWAISSSKFKGQKVVSALELREMISKERYKGRVHVPLCSGDFGSGDLPVDPWLLGVLIGDGSLTKGAMFSTPDAEILMRIQGLVGHGSVKHRSAYDYAITTPRGKPNPLLEALEELGLRNTTSDERFIPESYLMAGKDERIELLRGLMDSDGWVEKTGALCFSTSSQELADGFRQLVWSLGGVCTHRLVQTSHKPAHRLYIRHDDPASLMTLTKKKRRAKRSKPVRNTILSVEFDGVEQCQCISVSHPSKLYLTDDYVVTHNTALATSLAIRTARQNIPVGIVSIEMDADGLAQRILSELSGVPYFKYRRAGEMTESEMRNTVEAAKANEALPIHIVPPHVRDIGGIYASLKKIDRHFENMGGLGLVVVDYLQLARAKGNSTNERIAEISMGLKNIAKMLNCPVIALSQLSRQVEYREDKRPVLSDLRDSGQIEQDADVVLFCYRDYYYQSREPEKKDPEERADQLVALEQSRNVMEVITAKQRFGPIGSDRIGCAIETNRFWDLQAPTNQEELEF